MTERLGLKWSKKLKAKTKAHPNLTLLTQKWCNDHDVGDLFSTLHRGQGFCFLKELKEHGLDRDENIKKLMPLISNGDKRALQSAVAQLRQGDMYVKGDMHVMAARNPYLVRL